MAESYEVISCQWRRLRISLHLGYPAPSIAYLQLLAGGPIILGRGMGSDAISNLSQVQLCRLQLNHPCLP